ncbi:MFS transporter [Aquibacillus koreensis]|uniref:MFS transporter n=1 Tax=Aquibacillus koreensis TaxID=279446 RepID=A0A9X4AJ97_9BACI|nr:MFS transporter [Aquibacillus koreensis]MCT2535602.1 MFS transporter [Aquibacillus koreensis]MDC3420113.1 MFS transporter [Aquibacillus koreensis]
MKQSYTASVLIYCSVFIASSIYVMIPLQPRLAEVFNVSLGFISLSSTLFVFPYALGLLLFGMLADRFSLRSILLVGMAFLTLFTGLLALSESVYSLLTLRILQGIFAASFAPVTFSYCFRHFNGPMQAFAIAMINTGFLFAGVFGQMISAFFSNLFTYNGMFAAFFFFYLSCFIGLFITLQPSKTKQSYPLRELFYTILSCFKNQSLQKLYSITFFLLLTIMLFYGSFEIYLFNQWTDFPFSLQLFRLISLIGIIPAFFASSLIAHFSAIRVLRFSLILMMIGFMAPIISLTVPSLMIASIMMIASTSLSIPMVVLLVGAVAKARKSTAVAVYSFVLLIGASIGSILASLISFSFVIIMIPLTFGVLVFVTHLISE